MTPRSASALLLTPSRGLGGGIERFAAAVGDAFGRMSIEQERLDLRGPGQAGRVALYRALQRRASEALDVMPGPVRIVTMHRSLLPIAVALAGRPNVAGVSVVLHGIDIWGGRPKPELALLRRRNVRAVAVSAFSAGALGVHAAATVLHPAVSAEWYYSLITASASARGAREDGAPLRVLTTFRLGDWRQKGLPELIEACELLGHDYELTVCGSGEVDGELAKLVSSRAHVRLLPGLPDAALAEAMAASHVVVLATRLRGGRNASGEGFGLVLAEGQLAGSATIAPAFGGGHDTFVEGVTGHAPVDESPRALADVLAGYLDEDHRSRVAAAGRRLSAAYFEPTCQAERIVSRLL